MRRRHTRSLCDWSSDVCSSDLLRRLAALERQKIEDELLLVKETIAYLEDLLSHPEKILGVIKAELIKLREKYADPRRTKVYKGKEIGRASCRERVKSK